MMPDQIGPQWAPFLHRYANGEWRAVIFQDMILSDVRKMARETEKLSFLDIGCGGGFDSDPQLQRSISQVAGKYIGIEPDTEMQLGNIFSSVHRCKFEDADIEPSSIDIAFAVMVLEHIAEPERFWTKLYQILRPGGVFWGFTIDARHWFVLASLLTEKLHIKDLYLNMLHGERGKERYENYGVYYKSNTPQQILEMTRAFASTTVLNFNKVGQVDYYLPKMLGWLSRAYDRHAMRRKLPGTLIAVRAEK